MRPLDVVGHSTGSWRRECEMGVDSGRRSGMVSETEVNVEARVSAGLQLGTENDGNVRTASRGRKGS
jgi:hypothetical protein